MELWSSREGGAEGGHRAQGVLSLLVKQGFSHLEGVQGCR